MKNNGQQIDFYFDFISHNAYLAWHVLQDLASTHSVTLRPVPVLFAGFLKSYGQLGPAEVAPKLQWMNKNNLRKAAHLGIPLNAPAQHPFHPLFLLRLAAQPMDDETRYKLTTCLLRAVWVDGIDPNDREAVGRYLDADNLNGASLIEGTDSDSAKGAVRANTDEAISRGGFGVPTMIIGDELFWGYDDIEQLKWYIEGKDPLQNVDTDAHFAGWERARADGQHRAK